MSFGVVDERMRIPAVNLQALLALAFFIGALCVARMVTNIYSGKWPGGTGMITYLRMLLGFLITGAIVLGIYAFAGMDILSRR